MTLDFYKFHGAGNDFIIADNRNGVFRPQGIQNQEAIAALCDRHKGIGADGLMLLENEPSLDFKMIYFNSDGLPGTMCGNGGRCIVAFAHWLEIIGAKTRFMASDGPHQAEILQHKNSKWTISLEMSDTFQPVKTPDGYFVDTGSPHLVIFHNDVAKLDVVSEGRKIRYSAEFAPDGINVNFVQVIDQSNMLIRTYERGVEDETLACGTGTTAAAISAFTDGNINSDNKYLLKAPGGELQVTFKPPVVENEKFKNIFLTGPAEMVFSGKMDIKQISRSE